MSINLEVTAIPGDVKPYFNFSSFPCAIDQFANKKFFVSSFFPCLCQIRGYRP